MRYFMQAFTKFTAVLPLFVFFKARVFYESEKQRRYPYIHGKTILMANHTSMWDPILMGYLYCFREIRIWAADILYRRSRLFACFLNKMGFIRVNRDITDLSAIQEAIDTITRGGLMGIFPEGRLAHGPEMLPFKPGIVMVALRSGADIVPVFIDGRYGLFRRVSVMIGDKIRLSEYRPSPPDMTPEQELDALCDLLAARMRDLKQQLHERIDK